MGRARASNTSGFGIRSRPGAALVFRAHCHSLARLFVMVIEPVMLVQLLFSPWPPPAEFGYTESQGLPQLREQIASLYGSYVSMDDILVATPQECILLAISAAVEPESTVICTFPG